MKRAVQDPVARFHALVHERGPEECWDWQGACRKGYGTFKVGSGQFGLTKRSDVYAHRVAFYLANGHWPVPVCRHTCDRPTCCNPAHLCSGTVAQNNEDRRVRQRSVNPPGELSARAVLSNAQVAEMRALYAAGGWTQSALGARYGVAQATVSRIVREERYR